jgi:segregation and condensation protein B
MDGATVAPDTPVNLGADFHFSYQHFLEAQAAELVDLLDRQLSRPGRGLQLRESGAKWQIETRPDREDIVAGLRAERGARPLNDQALETLAVIALRQPVTTEEVTAIRGAESYATIETLRRQKLVARSEQRPAEGRAARWRTTQHFLDQFGLAHLEELYREGRIEKLFGSSLRSTGPCIGPVLDQET